MPSRESREVLADAVSLQTIAIPAQELNIPFAGATAASDRNDVVELERILATTGDAAPTVALPDELLHVNRNLPGCGSLLSRPLTYYLFSAFEFPLFCLFTGEDKRPDVFGL